MDLKFSTDIDKISWEEVVRLFELAPLGTRTRDPGQLEAAFRNSMLRVFAYDGDTLIGTGRALSDGVWRAAIYDVAVLPDYQGRGVGSAIIRRLVDSAQVDVVMLYSVPGKEVFYERFGFRRMRTAMALFSDEEKARERGLIE